MPSATIRCRNGRAAGSCPIRSRTAPRRSASARSPTVSRAATAHASGSMCFSRPMNCDRIPDTSIERSSPMKTGMNLLLWTTHVTAEHFPLFAKLKQAGYDGVEIPLFAGDAAHYKSIRKELDNHGLGCTTVCCATESANPISPDPGLRQAGLDHLKWAI